MLGLITGDHPRHKYLANKLINEGIVQYWVIETRESFIPDSSGINNAEIKNGDFPISVLSNAIIKSSMIQITR